MFKGHMRENISEIFKVHINIAIDLPLYQCNVPAGFPSPADDWLDKTLDLNDLLIVNPPATFLMRVSGDSMKDAGILNGSILVVDRSITPKFGMVVVASIDNGLTVKRYASGPFGPCLRADNPDYRDILITEDTTVWGVVKSTITQF